jgi:hypothetical protein
VFYALTMAEPRDIDIAALTATIGVVAHVLNNLAVSLQVIAEQAVEEFPEAKVWALAVDRLKEIAELTTGVADAFPRPGGAAISEVLH